MPLPDWEERYEVWSASHFRYEPQADQYRCPQGQLLHRVGGVNPDGRQLYRVPASICNACPVKGQCTTSTQGRRVYRHVGEQYLERVRTHQRTHAYQKALRIAAGQNLKRLLKKRGWGRRPFPVEALCASFWGYLRGVLDLLLEQRGLLVPSSSACSRLST